MATYERAGGWVTIDLDAPASGAGRRPRDPGAGGFDVLDVEFTGTRARAIEHGRNRMALVAACFLGAFMVLGLRVVELTLTRDGQSFNQTAVAEEPVRRAALVDRTGEVLATDVDMPSLYVDARKVIEPEATADALLGVLPHLDRGVLLARLTSGRAFAWIERKLGPRQQAAVHALGLPGIGFKREPHRVYPKGHSAAHVLGYVDMDNRGIAGLESGLDARIASQDAPVALTLDMRVQHAVEEELANAMDAFGAAAAAGVVLDVETGEVLGLASLPDYDPNQPVAAPEGARFNTATRGVYEMGSTFKVFTAAIALETGAAHLDSAYDARKPLRVAGHTINDFHPEKRWLTVPEVVMHSSNIGTARMALDIGVERHRAYLRRLGLLERPRFELPETAEPLLPTRWHEIETMTISYGHGLAVSPLQLAAAGAVLANGGYRVTPTLVAGEAGRVARERVLSADTAASVLALMRQVVAEGTGRNADVPGYEVAGKTGTAEKPVAGGYRENMLLTSFMAVFPASAPEYLVLVVLDEPKARPETFGFATAGWNAAPTAGRVIRRIAPILGVRPVRARPAGPEIVEAGLAR